MRRCKKCIIPEGYKNIRIDNEGVCEFCKHEFIRLRSLEEFKNFFFAKKGKFDCLIPVSGGKDSMFMLYYAVKKLNLNPLVLYYKSGFQTKIAQNNVLKACKKLNIPLIIKKANPKLQNALLRCVLRISEIRGIFFNTCLNCEVIIRWLSISVARKYKIPVVLWGSSFIDTRDTEEYKKYLEGKSDLIRRIFKRESYFYKYFDFSKILKMIIPLIKYLFLNFLQKKKLGVPMIVALNPRGKIPLLTKNPIFVPFFDYIEPMNLKEDIELLKKEINFEHPQNRKIKFDCKLYSFVNYTCFQLYGITDEGCIYSNYIRKGFMTREEALLKEKEVQRKIVKECKEIIKEAGFKKYKFPLPRIAT